MHVKKNFEPSLFRVGAFFHIIFFAVKLVSFINVFSDDCSRFSCEKLGRMKMIFFLFLPSVKRYICNKIHTHTHTYTYIYVCINVTPFSKTLRYENMYEIYAYFLFSPESAYFWWGKEKVYIFNTCFHIATFLKKRAMYIHIHMFLGITWGCTSGHPPCWFICIMNIIKQFSF